MAQTPRLSDDQVRDFHDQGFVLVRGAFAPTEAARIEGWARELAAPVLDIRPR